MAKNLIETAACHKLAPFYAEGKQMSEEIITPIGELTQSLGLTTRALKY